MGQVIRGAGGLWAVKAAIILVIGGLAVAFEPPLAGWLVGIGWILLLALPMVLMRAIDWLLVSQHYAVSAMLAAVVRLLHPDGSWTGQTSLSRALHLARLGRFDDAIALLQRVATTPGVPPDTGSTAHLHCRRLEGRLGLWLDETASAGVQSAQSVLLRMRALATLGRTPELIALQAEQGWRLQAMQMPAVPVWAGGLLWLWLGTGQVAELQRLLAGPLHAMRPGTKRFHIAVARLVAGLPMAEVGGELAALMHLADRDVAVAARLILAHPPPPVALTAAQRRVLDSAAADLDAYLAVRAERPTLRHSPVTVSLIAVNVAVFSVELARGASESTRGLLEMGALWAPYIVAKGQWWRIGAALFLHLGWMHLSLNMLALAVLGRLTENALGRLRMFAIYAVSGLGSMISLVLLMRLGWMRQELVIGASGAIMGLFGTLLAITAAGWWRERSPAARRRLFLVAGLIILQAAGDIATPQVSFAGHALGLVLGLLTGLALGHQDHSSKLLIGTRPTPGPVTQVARLGRRRAMGGVAAATIAIVAALSYPQQLHRAAAKNLLVSGARDLAPTTVAVIRHLHFAFVDDSHGGTPSVDPEKPLGSADALADISRITGKTRSTTLARLYLEAMAALPRFCAQARLAPGFYHLDGRLVMISAAQLRLISLLRWDTPDADEEVDADPDTGAWPVSSGRPKNTYGGTGIFEVDIANALGWPLPRDSQGNLVANPVRLTQLAALHRSMPGVLEAFVRYAALP